MFCAGICRVLGSVLCFLRSMKFSTQFRNIIYLRICWFSGSISIEAVEISKHYQKFYKIVSIFQYCVGGILQSFIAHMYHFLIRTLWISISINICLCVDAFYHVDERYNFELIKQLNTLSYILQVVSPMLCSSLMLEWLIVNSQFLMLLSKHGG